MLRFDVLTFLLGTSPAGSEVVRSSKKSGLLPCIYCIVIGIYYDIPHKYNAVSTKSRQIENIRKRRV